MKLLGFLKDTKIRDIPWIPMILEPRETIREVLRTNPRKNVILLGILYGLSYGVAKILSSENIVLLFNPVALLLVLLIASIFGLVYIHFLGGLNSIIGHWLGGKGGWKELTAAWAYSSIITLLFNSLLIMFIAVSMLAGAIFGFKEVAENQVIILISNITSVFALLISIINFIILVVAVSEAHKFSKWRALVSVALPGLILAAVLIAIIFISS
ncbi:MAG: YIP1 family protein [Candidatus Altiarchaeota archaeon]|nr:YIP1 family protein [Candidatus Altiarchaeota archaeon]